MPKPYYDISQTPYDRESLIPREDDPTSFDHLYPRKEVVDSLENRLQSLEQGIYPVQRYGAVGDGSVSDEGPAIQNAIDAAADAGGGTVFIPEGTYNLQTTLYIRSGVRMLMAKGAMLRRNSPSLEVMICPSGDHSSYSGASDWSVEGGTIDASSSYGTACLPIGLSHGEGVVVRDVHIRNVYGRPAIWINAMKRVRIQNVSCTGYTPDEGVSEYYAVFLSAATPDDTNVGHYPFSGNWDNTPCEDVLVEGCFVEGWQGGVGGESCATGVYHRNIRVVNNLLQDIKFCGVKLGSFQGVTVSHNELYVVGMGIEINPGGVAGQENNSRSAVVMGNVIRGMSNATYGYGIWVNEKGGKYVENSVVAGNVIDGMLQSGIYVQGSPFNSIVNNYVIEPSERGIYINGSSNCEIQGNTVRSAGHMGISLVNSSYCSVTGNYVTRCAGYAIDLSGSTHCLISSNMTYDNRLNSGIASSDAEIAAYSNADYCAFLNNVTRSPSNTTGIDMTSSIDNAYLNGNDCRYGASGTKAAIVGGTGTDKTSANYAG